ncbi:hypothetical protein D3C75_185370 [compost metagenome]
MESTNKMLPRLQIKRRLEEIIADEWKHDLVDNFKTSVDPTPQVWITEINESYSPISNVTDKKLNATCSITVVVFSETNETEVHQIISQLMDLEPKDFPGLRINTITPQMGSTNYQTDASEGHVMAAITLDLKYFFERNK